MCVFNQLIYHFLLSLFLFTNCFIFNPSFLSFVLPLQLLCSNKVLSVKIDSLSSSNEEARTRLQVIIQWWEEFCSNYEDVIPWLEEAESDLSELMARYSNTSSPRQSPLVLLQRLKVGTAKSNSVGPCYAYILFVRG